jgi:hypothetical protein
VVRWWWDSWDFDLKIRELHTFSLLECVLTTNSKFIDLVTLDFKYCTDNRTIDVIHVLPV